MTDISRAIGGGYRDTETAQARDSAWYELITPDVCANGAWQTMKAPGSFTPFASEAACRTYVTTNTRTPDGWSPPSYTFNWYDVSRGNTYEMTIDLSDFPPNTNQSVQIILQSGTIQPAQTVAIGPDGRGTLDLGTRNCAPVNNRVIGIRATVGGTVYDERHPEDVPCTRVFRAGKTTRVKSAGK